MSPFEYRLESYVANIKKSGAGFNQLFDPVRKKWVSETPEEWVRQSLIQYLHAAHQIPFSRMAVEKQVAVYSLKKRFDLVVYNKTATPYILIECKSPSINLLQEVMDQAARYNIQLKAPYLIVSNGYQSIVCKLDFQLARHDFIQELPDYPF